MALWDRVKTMLALEPQFESVQTLHVRTIPDMDMGSSTVSDLLLRSQGLRTSPWRAASVREAMGTPAIFRAVSLISNTTGSLAMETFRNGTRMPAEETPIVVTRPDPYRTQRAFYRDGGYHMATRGELWWWIAKRDGDGKALSLIVMPPWEVTVTQDETNRLRPKIEWLGVEMPRDDVRLITFMPDERSPAGPFQRGVGPLQLCGAAISVAVESQEWAANYFAGGGRPPLILKSASELGNNPDFDNAASEADAMRDQWMSKDANTPRVIDPGIEDVLFPPDQSQGGQMLDARNNENGNAARMFGIPGSLLEYQQSGSSLTYQNLEGEFTKFVKVCLAPGYLEPIEQEMSDLLSRSTVARFNVRGFTRADQKTRWETYQIMTAVLGPEEAATVAREQEGLTPGDVEFAPIPFAPPQAFPAELPIDRNLRAASQETVHDWRCSECGRKLAESAGPGTTVRCRCKAVNTVPMLEVRTAEAPQQPVIFAPTFNVPPQPGPTISMPPVHLTANVSMPEAEKIIGDLHARVDALGGSLTSHLDNLATDQALVEDRLSAISDSQENIASSLAGGLSSIAQTQDAIATKLEPKARTFVPNRDADGLILSITEVA